MKNSKSKKTTINWAKIVILLYLVGGIGLLFGGMFAGISAIVVAGIVVLFGGGFLLAVACLVVMFIRAKRYNDSIENRKANEEASKEFINNSRHNADAVAVRQIANWLQVLKLADKGDIVKSILFVVTFVGCMVSFVVLAGMGFGAWCILPWGIGVGMILIALIITKLVERRSISSKRVNKNLPSVKATVVGCYINSESSVGSGNRRATQTSRIVSTTYRVVVDIGDQRKTAYSKRYYNEGEEVYVRPITKTLVHIEEDEK